MGADVIEKHFTINKKLKGPDHKASLSPQELIKTVNDIKKTNSILGSYLKKPTNSEKKNIKIIRKSLFAKKKILLKMRYLAIKILFLKDPWLKITDILYLSILGKKSKRNYKKNQLIKL